MFSSLQKPKTCWTKYLQYHNFQHPYSLCTWYRSSRLLRSRPHRCPPSDFGSVRLVAFLRAAYSVPHPHSLRPGPPVIQAPLRALCSEIPKTHGRSSERQRCSLRAQSITAGTARHKSSPRLSAFSNRLKILQRPTDEFLKDWQQAVPQLCQRILHLRRYLGILPPADQPVHLQSFQCIRQNFRRYVRNRLGDGVETGVFIL